MAEEFEYTVETRSRVNLPDDQGVRPQEPNWGPWGDWEPRRRYRTYPTLAGAAMACSYLNGINSYRRYGTTAPYSESQARVSYRKVPKGWTPVLPVLEES